MAYPEWVSKTERDIIDAIIDRALVAGASITVRDEEGEIGVSRSSAKGAITAEVAATGMTMLTFYFGGANMGTVWLVHGNDEDVVSDMHDTEWMRHFVDGKPAPVVA